MGKCEKVITKSAKENRVGKTCGIYTKKSFDGVFLCSAHSKKVKNNNTSVSTQNNNVVNQIVPPVEENIPIVEENIPIVNISTVNDKKTLQKGNTLSEVLDYEFNKKKNSNRNTNSNSNSNQKVINSILRRLESVEKHVFKNPEIPEMEIFN